MKKKLEMGWRSVRAASWIEKHCRVPEGMKVGQPIELHPVQLEILAGIYDSPTRQAIISFGKKNGKTTLAACLTCLHLAGPESRPNSQIYSLGESRDQAAVLYGLAAKIVGMSPELSSFVSPRDTAKQLVCSERGSMYGALSAEASTAHGKSPVMLIHDELGQVVGPKSALYSALELSMGAHSDPLSIIISTQAPTDADLLSVLIDDARLSKDPKIKLFLWTAPEDADPWAEATWKLANPMYGVNLNPDVIRDAAEKAKRMPSAEADFRNYVLNQRVDAKTPFVSRSTWLECGQEVDRGVFEDRPVYAGLDMSSRNDLTALAYIANKDGIWHTCVEFFAPEEGLAQRVKRDRAPYDVWAKDGYITLTPGASVDLAFVAARVLALREQMPLHRLSYDRWRIDVLLKELSRLGATEEEIIGTKEKPGLLKSHGQGFRDMAPAIDIFESELVNKKIVHGNNPVLTWCVANARVIRDPAGNRKLDKTKATGRIDGIQALVMAFGATISAGPKDDSSVYEKRGLLEV